MYEHRSDPVVPRQVFAQRLAWNAGIAFTVLAISLFFGTWGYHSIEGLAWVDALLNASMILSGMGPIHSPVHTSGKLFASAYALFSGIALFSIAAVMLAPVIHRMLHRFHLETEEDEEGEERASRRKSRRRTGH